MTEKATFQLRNLEGRRVGLALADGSRIDDAQLISVGRPGTSSVWVFINGVDTFVPAEALTEVWEITPASASPVRA